MDSKPKTTVQHENAVRRAFEVFFLSLEKAILNQKVYANEAGDKISAQLVDAAFDSIKVILDEPREVEVRDGLFLENSEVVYRAVEKKASLPTRLYNAGIRQAVIGSDLSNKTLREFVNLMVSDSSHDIFFTLYEMGLKGLEFTGSNIIEDFYTDHAEEAKDLKDFKNNVYQKSVPAKTLQNRRIKPEDAKVLEEFRLHPQQLVKSESEVNKMRAILQAQESRPEKERETIEKILRMGFHFLITPQDMSLTAAGRYLIVHGVSLALSHTQISLVTAVLQKLYQLQTDHPHVAGDCQKVVDLIFHQDKAAFFKKLALEKNQLAPVLQLYMLGGISGAKRSIELLGDVPSQVTTLAPFILKNLAPIVPWLQEQAEKQPNAAFWEPLLLIISEKPGPQIAKVIDQLLVSAGEGMQLKLLKQLALIGTPESVRPFQKYLMNPHEKFRIMVYDVMAQTQSTSALILLKNYLERPEFEKTSSLEKEAAYKTMVLVAGDAAKVWFEKLWFKEEGGLFKKNANIERRSLLLKAIVKTRKAWLEEWIPKTNQGRDELQSLLGAVK